MRDAQQNRDGRDSSQRTFGSAFLEAVRTRRPSAHASGRRRTSPEFWLVIVMLATLFLLVLAVLLVPPFLMGVRSSDGTTVVTVDDREFANQVFEYRRTILAVIITAFGAWVGAGAAYFFGRENLREATSTMLQMRDASPRERLRKTPVRDIPPAPLDWKPREKQPLRVIYDRLKAIPEYWFIPVFDEKGGLVTVLEEEAFWRYLYDICEEDVLEQPEEPKEQPGGPKEQPPAKSLKTALDELLQREISQLIKHVKANDKLKSQFLDIYESCTMDESAADVYTRMQLQRRDIRLAIVHDSNGKPTHFFTTTELRRMLLEIV